MTLFSEDDFADTPILTEWQIVGDRGSQPQVFGVHAFHEGVRVAIGEVVIVDPLLRWVLTTHGGYRLAGGGTLGVQYSRFGTQKLDN